MIILLDEEMVGASPTAIGYPNLVTCIGITVALSNDWMVGAHSTTSNDAEFLCDGIWECINMINEQDKVTPGTVEFLCLTGNLTKHPGENPPRSAYREKFEGSPQKDGEALRGAVDLKVYDTQALYKGFGVFVLVAHQGTGRMPLVQYKNEKKMEYGPTQKLSGKDTAFKAPHNSSYYNKPNRFDEKGFWYSVKGAYAVTKTTAYRKGKPPTPGTGEVNVPVIHTAKLKG